MSYFLIYSMYSTLLAHKKLHIRNFAAESFTFLMRKVSLMYVYCSLILKNLMNRSRYLL